MKTEEPNIELALAKHRAKPSSGQAAQHFLTRGRHHGFEPMTMLFREGIGFYAIGQHRKDLLQELLDAGWRLKGQRAA